MTVQFSIFDDKTSSIAKVSSNGELIVAPVKYSTAFYVLVDAANVAFEIIPTIVNMNFVVTGILLASTRTFGTATSPERLTIYQAMSADLETNVKTLFQIDLLKNDRVVATGMNLLTSVSTSLVASATDTDVDVTISGYYIQV